MKNLNSEITIATYNQMYACDGISLFNWLRTHYHHIRKNHQKVAELSDINRTIETIKKINPDILGLSEILGSTQRREIISALRNELQYVDFHSGKGHRLGNGEYVETLLATKRPSTSITTRHFNAPPEMGYGGGIVQAKVDDIHVIQVHLPFPQGKTKSTFDDQLKYISEIAQDVHSRGEKCIVMGDFNLPYRALGGLSNLSELSPDKPTCPMTNRISFFQQNVDHILGSGFELSDNGIITGKSDHAMVWARVNG